ncbi:FadR/GntR family transcriptional regulator [Temperatibacter marinus]|uniref:FadR/GntR family transcriptional regulator n=1 Tax=Temperatibacter marinus TaxID=1456591 RepID=A0AA52HA47_9PROT|nr:FadR/GntR family transcriptional regulator [Temperatibacter marinus]WND03861.1 FadR/GntR family transcriptional regulator [Temperatibacter marinus]
MTEKRLYQKIADAILSLIEERKLTPGSRLPGERELAEQFGVSRVIIREAEIALETRGYIEVRTGSGAYVIEQNGKGQAEYLPEVSPFELTEARTLFEGEAAALAAPIISEEDLNKLEASIFAMSEEQPHNGLSGDEADREFHMTIARASKNPAVIHMVELLWKLRAKGRATQSVYKRVCEEDTAYRESEHEHILQALRERDPMKARAAMRQHFNRLLDAMLVATEQEAVEKIKEQVSASRERFTIARNLG